MSIPDWQKQAAAASTRPGGKTPKSGSTFRAIITAVNAAGEKVDLEHTGEAHGRNIMHPYLSKDSWLRVIPETGTGVIATIQHDTQGTDIAKYDHDTEERVRQYEEEDAGLYRKMFEGEIHGKSVGHAEFYMSRRGNFEIRGGVSWMHLCNDEMEIASHTAVHRRELHNRSHLMLGSEERFGVVKRKGTLIPAASQFVAIGPVAALEYYRSLRSSRATAGTLGMLVEHHEGDLFDSNMIPVLGGPVMAPLRAKHSWGTETALNTTAEIDITGAIALNLAESAVAGLHLNMLTGLLKIDALRATLSTVADFSVLAAQAAITAAGGVTVMAAPSAVASVTPAGLNIAPAGGIGVPLILKPVFDVFLAVLATHKHADGTPSPELVAAAATMAASPGSTLLKTL